MADNELHSIAFPKLDDDCLVALGECPHTVRKTYADGEALFRAGDRDSKFFVVISGRVEIVDETGDEPKTVVVHDHGQFAGDVSQITGRPAVVSAYARGTTEVYEVSQVALREMVNAHPELADIVFPAFIARRQLLRASTDFQGLRVIGPHSSADTFRVRDFLTRNNMKCTWLDSDADPTVADLMKKFGFGEADMPVVLFGRVLVLRNPSNRELAEAVGLRRKLEPKVYDLVIVGAGPAGLAAAVYAASEGLSTVVLEQCAPGGQAERIMRIENYLGFPTGITGSELADRAVLQASKFGAALPVASEVVRLAFDSPGPVLHLDGDETVAARCVLIATGAEYRVLGVEGCDRLTGRGVYYAAGPMEAELVPRRGGRGRRRRQLGRPSGRLFWRRSRPKSSGDPRRRSRQKHVELSRPPHRANRNIVVERNSEIRRLDGDDSLREIEWVNTKTGETPHAQVSRPLQFHRRRPANRLAPPEIERDAKEFVKPAPPSSNRGTGPASGIPTFWKRAARASSRPATSEPARSSASPSAVGEGSMAVQFVHEHLKQG